MQTGPRIIVQCQPVPPFDSPMLDETEVRQIISRDMHCVHEFDVSCEMCRLRGMCLPAAISAHEIEALESVIDGRLQVPAREHVYREGQAFTHIYAVVYGAVKTYFTYRDGSTCVTGLHLPGEMFGFSGIGDGVYSVNARALENSGLCALPFDDLERCCRSMPGLQSRLLHLMSDRIVDYQHHFAQLSASNAVQRRVATFLISLSSRAHRRGESTTRLHMPMTGEDTASYLGISAETLSREFSRLAREGIIIKAHRDITLLDKARLRRTVCDHAPDGE